MVLMGVVNIVNPETYVWGELLAAFTGTGAMPPAMMIATGMGLIGLRAAHARQYEDEA